MEVKEKASSQPKDVMEARLKQQNGVVRGLRQIHMGGVPGAQCERKQEEKQL